MWLSVLTIFVVHVHLFTVPVSVSVAFTTNLPCQARLLPPWRDHAQVPRLVRAASSIGGATALATTALLMTRRNTALVMTDRPTSRKQQAPQAAAQLKEASQKEAPQRESVVPGQAAPETFSVHLGLFIMKPNAIQGLNLLCWSLKCMDGKISSSCEIFIAVLRIFSTMQLRTDPWEKVASLPWGQ